MGTQLFANNPTTTLAADLPATGVGSTTMFVASAALFPPTLTGGDYFVVTIQEVVDDVVTAQEIVQVTAVDGVEWTIVRAQEGTLAAPWTTGNSASLLITAGGLNNFQQVFEQTAAEAATTPPTVPLNDQFPELTLERYGGGAGASTVANIAALTTAFLVVAKKGGGTIRYPAPNAPNGAANFGNGQFVIPENTIIQGSGPASIWLSTLAGNNAFLTTAAGRCQINDIYLQGVAQGGRGLVIGAPGLNSNRVVMNNVIMNQWNVALYIYGTIWSMFRGCEFGSALGGTVEVPVLSNNVGIQFNPTSAGNYSAQNSWYDCIVANNALNGITSTNTSTITNNNFYFSNINVQSNCVNNPALAATPESVYQMFIGLCNDFAIEELYIEYQLGSPTPCGLGVYGLGYGRVQEFFMNNVYDGITDGGGGSAVGVWVGPGEVLEVGHDAVNCNSNDIICWQVDGSPIVNIGAGSVTLSAGSGIASWQVDEQGFSPALACSTSGAITGQTSETLYSLIGNVLTAQCEISWTGVTSPVGNLEITGFPVPPKAGGPPATCAPGYFSGITLGANQQLGMEILAGSTTANLYECGGSSAAVNAATQVASGGSVRFTISFHV